MSADEATAVELRDLEDGLTTVMKVRETNLDEETATLVKAELREALLPRLAAGRKRFILNLGPVVMVDSSGLGVLIATRSLLHSYGARLVLTDMSDMLTRLLRLTRLDRVMDLSSTEEEAIQAGSGGN